jgi:hypothetical protein
MTQAIQFDNVSEKIVSPTTLFYGNESFEKFKKDREAYLRGQAIARKDARNDETYNFLDIIETAPYETDVAFEPTGKDGESYGEKYPNARERFLQLDFLDNVLDLEADSPLLNEVRQDLIKEGFVTDEGNLDVDKLRSLHNPDQYRTFLEYVFSNEQLDGRPYEERKRPDTPRVRLSPMQAARVPSGLSNELFDINEDQRAQYAARGADPDTNYMSLLNDEQLNDLSRGRIVSPRTLNKRELENLLRRFDKSAVVSYVDFSPGGTESNQFIVTSDLTGGVPVPFGNIQPLESFAEGNFKDLTTEIDVFISQEAPAAVAGLGFVKLLRNGLEKRANKQIERNIQKIEKGETILETSGPVKTGLKMFGYASVSGIGEATAEAAKLLYAREMGYQPDITDDRIWKISGLAGIYAFGGEFGSELALKAYGKVKNMFTGERLPEDLLARLRASGEYLRRKRKRAMGELPTDAEISTATMNEFIMEAGGELGEDLNTLGDLTNDRVLQSIENNLLGIMDQGSEGYAALNRILQNEGGALDRYYEAFGVRLRPDQKLDRETFNELVNRVRITNRQKRKEAIEGDIFDIERQLDLEETVVDERAVGPTSDVVADVQNIVEGGRPSYPEYSSELMTMYREFVDPIRGKYDDVLNKTVTDIDGNDFQVYQEPVVPLPKYISEQLNRMLNANKPEDRIFGSADDAEVAEMIRGILQNRADEGISIQQLADPKKFEAQRRFSIEEITRTMENLESMFNSHPNQKVREEGKKLLQGLADARSEAYRIQYKKITGSRSVPTEAGNPDKFRQDVLSVVGGDINDVKQEIIKQQDMANGRYFYQIATKEPSELGSYILNSKPTDVDGLIGVLSETPEGLAKLQQIRKVVFDAIDQEISGDGVNTVQQANRLSKLSSRNREQLRLLFPQTELNPKDFQKIKLDLQNSERQLAQVNSVLENMINPETGDFAQNPIEVVDAYFRMSPEAKRDFRGTETWSQLKELSTIADEYPDLRTAFRTDFQRRLDNLAGVGIDTPRGQSRFRGAKDRIETGFDLDELTDLVLYAPSDKDLAQDLSLIVGENEALNFAKNLRNFARRAKILVAKEKRTPRDGRAETLETIMERATGTLTRVRKGITGQLSRFGYRTNLLLGELSPKVANHLSMILGDPKKLDEFMKVYDTKRLPLSDSLRLIEQIALGREGAQDAEETEVDKFKKEVREEFNL